MFNFLDYKKRILIKPYFISITTSQNNLNLNIIKFFIKNNINIIPHIICTNITLIDFKNNLYFYYINNIKKILILKGDNNKDFYYSYNLINLVKKNFNNFFYIYSAVYCESHNNSFNFKNDLKNSLIKINFNNICNITQYFYNIESFLYFIDEIKKIKKKFLIIPGVMPILSIEQIIKFSNICKSEIPSWFIKRLNNYNINNDIKIFNIEIIINLIFKLINFNIKKIHIYTMNNIKYINFILDKVIISNNV